MDKQELDINEIMDLIPHRPPFLLVERICSYEPDKEITGTKNVSINEPYFAGHFPDYPIMPGVLIIEAMAQVGVVFIRLETGKNDGDVLVFRRIERAKFKKPVVPGDCLEISLELLKTRGNLWKFRGSASVRGDVVATAELVASTLVQE